MMRWIIPKHVSKNLYRESPISFDNTTEGSCLDLNFLQENNVPIGTRIESLVWLRKTGIIRFEEVSTAHSNLSDSTQPWLNLIPNKRLLEQEYVFLFPPVTLKSSLFGSGEEKKLSKSLRFLKPANIPTSK